MKLLISDCLCLASFELVRYVLIEWLHHYGDWSASTIKQCVWKKLAKWRGCLHKDKRHLNGFTDERFPLMWSREFRFWLNCIPEKAALLPILLLKKTEYVQRCTVSETRWNHYLYWIACNYAGFCLGLLQKNCTETKCVNCPVIFTIQLYSIPIGIRFYGGFFCAEINRFKMGFWGTMTINLHFFFSPAKRWYEFA